MRARSSGIKPNRLSAALFTVLALPLAGTAFAQDAAAQEEEQATAPAQASEETTELDRVTVTGSRIKRAEIEGPAPVTIITADDLEQQGFSTVYDALNTLTQFTGSIQNELTQNGFTPNASFLNLRGLGPGYQLILINGRRVADYPLPYNSQSNAVNLNAIPAAAIERIEILSGGASAIYGSDAVAGVVNIIMKSNYEGDMITLRGGTTTRGGGDTGRAQWVGGKAGSNWSLTYAFEYLAREEIYASQRDFMDSYRDDPSVDPSQATAVGGVQMRDSFTGDYIWPAPGGLAEICGRFSEFETFAFNSDTINRCYYYGYPATQAIRNADDNLSAYLYGTFDFTDTLQGFAQLSMTDADATLSSSTQFWQSGHVYVPSLGTLVNTQRIFTPDEVGGIGAQSSKYSERAIDVAAGLRGTMFDDRFDWDATISHGRYELDVNRPRFLANEVNDYFLGPQLGLDPFFGVYPVYNLDMDRYFSPIDPDTFKTLNTTVRTEAESKVTQASFVLSGDLFELPAGPLGMAAVIEAASQEYELISDPRIRPDYTGDEPIYNLTGTGGGGERDRYAVGLELSIPIFDSLKASLAGRYDKYDDVTNVDGASTWMAGLEWRPFDSLLFRGSHSTSFRAPDMHYVFAQESGFFTTVLDEYRCRRDGLDPTAAPTEANNCRDNDYVYSVFGLRSGSTELEEETGKSTTVGFVWDVIDNMSVSMDWYQIELEGGVSDIDTSYLLRNEADCLLGQTRDGTPVDINTAGCQYFLSLVERTGIDSINDDEIDQYRSVPFNQAKVETSGIDASWKYWFDTDRLGRFDLDLSWTHVLKLDVQDFPGSPVINTRDHMQYFNFRSRVNWTATWTKDDWRASIYGYRWGSLPNWEETGRIAPYIIWNANVQKKITDNATVGLFVNNVLDKLHPEDDSFNSYPFFWRAYSPIGREVFVQFSYQFD